MDHCKEANTLQSTHESALKNEQKTLIVIIVSFVTMIAEIIAGNLTGSMSLLADGWHMGSHVAALLLSYVVYKLARSTSFQSNFTFGSAKLFSLGGFTSAIGLSFIAFIMAYESVMRFFNPVDIEFNEALIVCVIGLVVNLFSAYILKNDRHHDHEDHDHEHDHDHNQESALAHVLADALTSVTAIFALLMGKFFQLNWIDPLIGLLGSAVIMKWSYSLLKNTGYELMDGKQKSSESETITKALESDGGRVVDLHIWSVGGGKIAATASIETTSPKGAQFYHQKLESVFHFSHLVIEEIKKP